MKVPLRNVYYTATGWGLFALSVGLFMIASPLTWLVLKAGGVAEPREVFQRMNHRFGVWYLGLFEQLWGGAVRFLFETGGGPLAPGSPVFYVANHAGTLDVVLCMAAISRCAIVGKRRMLYIPFFGLAMRMGGMIFVDRRRRFEGEGVLRELAGRVRGGESVLIFPQGTRAVPWSRRSVKRGIFKLILEERIPVVPLAVVDSRYIVTKSQVVTTVEPGLRVRVVALPPVAPEGDPARIEDVTALRDRVVDLIDGEVSRRKDLVREWKNSRDSAGR